MSDKFVIIGKIVGAHGIRGEVKLFPFIDDVDAILGLEEVFTSSSIEGPMSSHAVEESRVHKATILVKFQAVPTRNDAEALVGQEVFVPEALQPKLPKGSFKLKTLVGLTVLDPAGTVLGRVQDVDLFANRAVLQVSLAGEGSVAVPFVPEYVVEVDLDGGKLVVTDAFPRLLAPEEVGP